MPLIQSIKNGYTISIAVILSILLSACGGSSTSSDTESDNDSTTSITAGNDNDSETSITGKVADGYLQGAKVCLDKNENDLCDQDEPFDISDSSGSYTFEASKEDLAKYPIVAEVTENTIDQDTSTKVGSAYSLSTPAGKGTFVSPITTLIRQSQQGGDYTLEESENLVVGRLGYENRSDLDPYADFIDKKTNGDDKEVKEKYKKAHNVAQTVARLMGNNRKKITTKLGDNATIETMRIINLAIYEAVINVLSVIATNSEADDFDHTKADELVKQVDHEDNKLIEDGNVLTLVKDREHKQKIVDKATPTDLLTLLTSDKRYYRVQTEEKEEEEVGEDGDDSEYKLSVYHLSGNNSVSTIKWKQCVLTDVDSCYTASNTELDHLATNTVTAGKVTLETYDGYKTALNRVITVNIAGLNLRIKDFSYNPKIESQDLEKTVNFTTGDVRVELFGQTVASPLPSIDERTFETICGSNGNNCVNDERESGGDINYLYIDHLPSEKKKIDVNRERSWLKWLSDDEHKQYWYFCKAKKDTSTDSDYSYSECSGLARKIKSYYSLKKGLTTTEENQTYNMITVLDVYDFLYDNQEFNVKIYFDFGEDKKVYRRSYYIKTNPGKLISLFNKQAIEKIIARINTD